jgi:hypothetical protein
MLMTKGTAAGLTTTEGWARLVLIEAGAIRECEDTGGPRTASTRMPASGRS